MKHQRNLYLNAYFCLQLKNLMMELNPGPIVPPPDIPTVKRKIRVLSLFDGIATG